MFTLDFPPVVKLFTPDAGRTWLLTELDPDDTVPGFSAFAIRAFASRLGYAGLAGIRGSLDLPVGRDLHFAPAKPPFGLCRRGPPARAASRSPGLR